MSLVGEYAAEIIAFCALLYTGWNVHAQRKHNRLAVKPHLSSFVRSSHNGEAGVAKLELMNNGLGPAFIKKFQIYLDGQPYDYDEALRIVAKDMNCQYQRTHLGKGYSMRAGEIQDIFSAVFPCTSNEELEATKEKFNVLDVEVEYECAYGKVMKFDTF